MLTPDQLRLRLQQCFRPETCEGCLELLALLSEVLPELVAPTQTARPAESQVRDNPMGLCGRAWGAKACPFCTPEQPCDRVRALIGEQS